MGMGAMGVLSASVHHRGSGKQGQHQRRSLSAGWRNRYGPTHACQDYIDHLRTGVRQGRLEEPRPAEHGRCGETLCRNQCTRLRGHRRTEDGFGAEPRGGTYGRELRRGGHQQHTGGTDRHRTLLAGQCFYPLAGHRTRRQPAAIGTTLCFGRGAEHRNGKTPIRERQTAPHASADAGRLLRVPHSGHPPLAGLGRTNQAVGRGKLPACRGRIPLHAEERHARYRTEAYQLGCGIVSGRGELVPYLQGRERTECQGVLLQLQTGTSGGGDSLQFGIGRAVVGREFLYTGQIQEGVLAPMDLAGSR